MGLFFPYLEDLSEDLHPWQEELLCLLHTDDGGHLLVDNAGRDLVQSTTISDYELAAGDLFKASTDELVTEIDPFKAATSMMSNDDDSITSESAQVGDTSPMQSEKVLTEAKDDCNDLLAECKNEDTLSEQSDVKIPTLQIEEGKNTTNGKVVRDGPMLKAVSSSCLTSADWSDGSTVEPNFFDSQRMELGFALQRTYSKGDTQTPGNASLSPNPVYSLVDQKIEERKRKISRYQKKKTKRDFSRKIKYACRKALADSQPRVRGRFAKAEGCEESKPCIEM